MTRVARTLARFVGLAVLLYGAWIFGINLLQALFELFGESASDPGAVLYLVLGFGLVGAVGGTLYLLSFDGPERFRTRGWRWLGWVLMLICVSLPTGLNAILLVMVAAAGLPLVGQRKPEELAA